MKKAKNKRKTKQKGRNGFALLGRISIDQKMHFLIWPSNVILGKNRWIIDPDSQSLN